jgi:hypothetical protein
MAEKQKACPQCGSEMSFRLGAYECPQCGHAEEDRAVVSPPVKSSGPGFRREAWHRPATPGPGQQPPPESTGTMFTPGAAPPPGLYGGYGDVATTGMYPTLETEKKVLFGLQAGCGVLGIILSLVGGIAAQAGGAVLLNLIFDVVAFGIGIWLLWYVLFESPLWLKRACCASQGCSFAIVIFALFMATSPAALDMLQISQLNYSLYVLAVWIVLLPQLLWNGWIMFILYRDIQQMRGG